MQPPSQKPLDVSTALDDHSRPDGGRREAILLIPGFYPTGTGSAQPDAARDGLLIPGLAEGGSAGLLETKYGPCSVRRLQAQGRTWDVAEASWRDLWDDLGQDKPDRQVLRTLGLLPYWLRIFRRKSVWQERSLTFGLFTYLTLMMLWYLSTIIAGWTLLSGDFGVTGLGSLASWLTKEILPHPWPWVHSLWLVLKSPVLWALLGLLLLILRVTTIMNIADFSRNYLTDLDSHVAGPLVRGIHQRLADTCLGLAEQEYPCITIVAHSMGVLLAIRLLADEDFIKQVPDKTRLRLITLGGSLPFLALRCPSIQSLALTCQSRLGNRLEVWLDFYSRTDWLASNFPVLAEVPDFCGQDLWLPSSLAGQVTGRVHIAYFTSPPVQKAILGQLPFFGNSVRSA